MTWINFPKIEGQTSRQAHVDLPANTYERELGKEGFYGPSTQMYHRHPPTAWESVDGALRPRAFDTQKLDVNECSSPWDALRLFENNSVAIRFLHLESDMDHLVRNADGDELLFIHQGDGELYCDYGRLEFNEGDYVVLPRGTMWRVEIRNPVSALMIEATGHSYGLPEKGMVGTHAVFDPAILDTPAIDPQFLDQQDENRWRVVVKRRNQLSIIGYPHNPLDALGWHGTLMPVRLNWRDIRPLSSHRYHVPPSAHTTFTAHGFVVCTFVPRPLESEPGTLNVPFFHSNDDYDELIFYHRGKFFSRDHIYPGMLTLHPSGITHGPHPKAMQHAEKLRGKSTHEVALMIDTREALDICDPALDVEWTDYVDSWK